MLGQVQKPDLLTTFSRSDGINNTNLNINDLTPASDGQDIPAKGGQGHRLFQLNQYFYYMTLRISLSDQSLKRKVIHLPERRVAGRSARFTIQRTLLIGHS
jgi:hypothetical protein